MKSDADRFALAGVQLDFKIDVAIPEIPDYRTGFVANFSDSCRLSIALSDSKTFSLLRTILNTQFSSVHLHFHGVW
jgi:hypothetical protein